MNFFTVGFFLACLQLDLGLGIGYVIKLVGGLFMLGGIAELGVYDREIERYKPLVLAFIPVCTASAAAVFALSNNESDAIKYAGIGAGAATTVIAALFYRQLIRLLERKPELADNTPEVKKLAPRYDRMLFVTAVVLVADSVNRFMGGDAAAQNSDSITAADIAGIIMYFTKIIFYVYLVICSLSFNKLRISFNSAHPAG